VKEKIIIKSFAFLKKPHNNLATFYLIRESFLLSNIRLSLNEKLYFTFFRTVPVRAAVVSLICRVAVGVKHLLIFPIFAQAQISNHCCQVLAGFHRLIKKFRY
jgi:hypothetical protein